MSSLGQITESYLVDLDVEGKKIYRDMREAEMQWIEQTGFRHIDFGNRTHLLITNEFSPILPDYSQIELTRKLFYSWVKEHSEGRPQTIGDRSTALPVWISSDGKFPISDVLPADMEPITKVRVRTHRAWRGAARLSKVDVLLLYQLWLEAAEERIEKCGKRRHRAEQERAKERKSELLRELAAIEKIYDQYGNLSARLFSGETVKFHVKAEARNYTTTIATVGIVLGTADTEVEIITEQLRQRHNNRFEEVARVGKLAFFRENN